MSVNTATAGHQKFSGSSRPTLPSPRGGEVKLSTRRLTAINAMWLGQGATWPPITFALLPATAVAITGTTAAAAVLIGNVSAAGNLFALLAPILAGWLSDRTRTRWGRRRPWILAGTAVNLAGLGFLALSGASLTLAIAYMLVQLSFNLAGGAYAAVIPDVVPAEDRGRASGLLGMMQCLGSVLGLGAVVGSLALFGEHRTGVLVGYACVIAILLVSTVVTLLAVKEPAPPAAPPAPLALPPTAFVAAAAGLVATATWITFLVVPLGSLLYPTAAVCAAAAVIAGVSASRLPAVRSFFVAFRDNDFFWTFSTRALMVMGVATIQPFLSLYFQDVIGVRDPNTMAGLWGLALLAGAMVPAAVGGHLSDRLGRRKLFVYLSGGLQALVASVLLFGLISNLVVVYVLGVIFGIGYGMYIAVDWALACDVLPDREHNTGRDMGLWHIAFTLPLALAPAIFGHILGAFNEGGHSLLGLTTGHNLGFRLVFAGAVVWFVLGTVFVSRIRSVR
jgi:MFS family permease